MRLTVVGCSGSFPGPTSPASCYLVEADGCRVVVDLGNGALGPLQRHTDIYAVDAVLLSHLHPDHCLDLCPYYVARRYRPEGPAGRLPVYGPAGTAARIARAYGLPEPLGMSGEFDFRPYPTGTFDVGPLRISVAAVIHPVEAYGMRIEHAGSSLAYSGDTAATPALVELARDAEAFVCEASFADGDDNPPGLHLTGREAGEHAKAAGVGRLIVTHVPPWGDGQRALEEAAGTFDGEQCLAEPGLALDV